MNGYRTLERGFMAAAIGTLLVAPRPAAANGAASTRNIFLGTAAAAAGTLLIINHNKQVHAKYAEDARRQAATQDQANQAQAAYSSERSAYDHQSAIVREYRKEVAYRQRQVDARDREIVQLKHSLVVAKYGRVNHVALAPVRPVPVRALIVPVRRSAVLAPHAPRARQAQAQPQTVAASYGWGTY